MDRSSSCKAFSVAIEKLEGVAVSSIRIVETSELHPRRGNFCVGWTSYVTLNMLANAKHRVLLLIKGMVGVTNNVTEMDFTVSSKFLSGFNF